MSTSRLRTQNNSGLLPQAYCDYYKADGTFWYSENPTDVAANYEGNWKKTYDNVNPGYRKRMARGEIIMSDFKTEYGERKATNLEFTAKYATGSWSRKVKGDYMARVEAFMGQSSLTSMSDADLTRLAQIALIEAYEKMNAAPLMTGEFLGTLDQGIGMLRRPFSNSIKLIAKMNKSRLRNLGKTANSAARASANAWLEYRYGWKPIILDGHQIIQECHATHDLGRRRLVVRAGKSFDRNYSDSRTIGGVGWVTSIAVGEATLFRGSANAGVMYEVAPTTSSSDLQRISGLRTRDIPSTAWELIPLSFVIDWFVGVGSWLQAVTPVPGISVLGSWVTTTRYVEQDISANWTVSGWPYGTQTGSCGSVMKKNLIIQRTANPSLASTPVRTVGMLSALHSVDGLALAANKILASLGRFR